MFFFLFIIIPMATVGLILVMNLIEEVWGINDEDNV
jgi:hypothetical protein